MYVVCDMCAMCMVYGACVYVYMVYGVCVCVWYVVVCGDWGVLGFGVLCVGVLCGV